MKLIKRYANRKLYDTEDKRYVSLSDIRELIRKEVDLRVIDNESGDDITSVTLSQIIYEQEKRREGLLPPSVLMGLIQAGGSTVVDSIKKLVSTGFTAASRMQDDVEKTIKRFLRTGELSEKEAEQLRREMELSMGGPEDSLEEKVRQTVDRMDVVSKGDIDKLYDLVQHLQSKVDELLEKQESEAEQVTEKT